MYKPYQDQFLLLQYFFHITWEAFERIEFIQFSKIMIFIFHTTHHEVTKYSQNTKIRKLVLAPTIPRSIPFALKLFPHHFGGICKVSVQPHFQNKICVFHRTNHQVTKSTVNTKITKVGYAPTIPRSIPFAPKLFPHHFGGIGYI